MKDDFKLTIMKKKIKKWEFEKNFYQHFFKNISENEGIPIENFYHPKNS